MSGVEWPGHPDRYDPEDIRTLSAAEKASGQSWAYWQGGYSRRIAASFETHMGGGVVDLVPRDKNWKRAAAALEAHGWTAYIRTGAGWFGNEHIHAVRRGSSTQHPSAKRQADTRGPGTVALAELAKFFPSLGIVGALPDLGAIGGGAVDAAKGVASGLDAVGSFFAALGDRGTWVRVLQVVGGAVLIVGGVVIVGRGVIQEVAVSAIPGGPALKAAAGSVK